MYNAKILLSAAALAGTSVAQTATQTAFSTDPACLTSLSKFTDVPTPAPELASFFASIVGTAPVTAPGETTALPDFTLEDPDGYQALFCSIAAELPESLIPDFKSYGSGLLSYGSVHLSDYNAYVTDCITTGSVASSLTSALNNMLTGSAGLCQTTSTAAPGGSNSTYPTGTGSYTVSPTSTSTLVPIAAAARPTGAVLGAAALGGLLGAVALL
ncbi:hypothetical protein F5Y09DRAFT_30182 [Xylaria sp. FL1042]|nr:hypothetical protein F5Y09DRAFT_30182 [Xylaria sp. FL1042]